MKRSLVAILLLIAALLSACGAPAADTPAETPADAQTDAAPSGTESEAEDTADDADDAMDAMPAAEGTEDEGEEEGEVYLPEVSQGDEITAEEELEAPAEEEAAPEAEETTPAEEEAAPEAEQPAATDDSGGTATDADCASEEVLCIGLVTDAGYIDDRSFNQAAWEALQQAEADMGAVVNYIETADATDYADNIALFAEQGYDVIVTVGFALGEATLTAADEYPDIHFIGVDQFQVEPVENVAGLVFEEDKSGYLAGALAAQMSESGIIAAVLGTDLVPPVVAFKEGFESGAQSINPAITIISTYHPGGLDVAFTDPEWGATTARQALDQGADVIFGAGGLTGNGALIETASSGDAYCIGVDSDQWETLPEAHPCLISSALKKITPGVYNLVELETQGAFPAGNYIGDVGLAPFHDFESEIPEAVMSELDEIEAGLMDGSIDTGYNPGG